MKRLENTVRTRAGYVRILERLRNSTDLHIHCAAKPRGFRVQVSSSTMPNDAIA